MADKTLVAQSEQLERTLAKLRSVTQEQVALHMENMEDIDSGCGSEVFEAYLNLEQDIQELSAIVGRKH